MAHPNAELATGLRVWSEKGEDRNGIFTEGKRKGLIIRSESGWELSTKGMDFISNWTRKLTR